MIQYLGEHKLFNEKYIIFILFCIFLIEFKNYFSHKNKEKGYTLVISLMYLGEAILFLSLMRIILLILCVHYLE